MRFARLVALLVGTLTAVGFQAPAGITLGTVTGRVIEVPSSESDKGIRKALVILKRGEEPGIGVFQGFSWANRRSGRHSADPRKKASNKTTYSTLSVSVGTKKKRNKP